MNIKGKKLLILGANAETIPIARRAQELGVLVTVTDHIKNSPAKYVADNYFDVSGKDTEKIITLIEKMNIDGVLLGVADPLMESYVVICNKLNLPCHVVADTIDFFRNKDIFKHLCNKNNIPIIKKFFSSTHLIEVDKKKIIYPIVVKPIVSRGGNGISYCRNEQELDKVFKKAQVSSDNLLVMGEEYIDSREDVVATFIFPHGKAQLLAMSDRKMLNTESKLKTVTYSNIFPSVYTELFEEQYLEKFIKLFENLRINKGIVNIQMFVHNGEFIPYDPDCIINGEGASNLFKDIFKVDVIGSFIHYALTGEYSYESYIYGKRDINDYIGASVWILLKEGTIGVIRGKEEIEKKDYVIDSIWRIDEGTRITKEMVHTEKATLARIWVKAKDRKELDFIVAEVRESIDVFDIYGNSMIENWEE